MWVLVCIFKVTLSTNLLHMCMYGNIYYSMYIFRLTCAEGESQLPCCLDVCQSWSREGIFSFLVCFKWLPVLGITFSLTVYIVYCILMAIQVYGLYFKVNNEGNISGVISDRVYIYNMS